MHQKRRSVVSDRPLCSLVTDSVQGRLHGDIAIHVARVFSGQCWGTEDLQLSHLGNHLAWRSCLGEFLKLRIHSHEYRLIDDQ
jgi:hypothetical protein